MDDLYNSIFHLSDEREKTLWSEAIFVFDSSALLQFYSLPVATRRQVFDEFFNMKLSQRLWLPNHVSFEFEKNRKKVIKNQYSELYLPLQQLNMKNIKKSIVDVKNQITTIKNATKKADKHPHLPQDKIDDYQIAFGDFEKQSVEFENWLASEMDSTKKNMMLVLDVDDVKKAVNDYFSIGRYYSFDEVMEITKEGKHRYEFSIPPGYEDLRKGEKKGTQIFGDLIVWKQTLEHAKETQKPIILIINDVKADWCYKQENTNENRIERPREELIKEIFDHAGVDFWMYDLPSFLYNSNKYFQAEIDQRKIYELAVELKKKDDESSLIFICEECGLRHQYRRNDFDLEFECIGGSERSMGTENHYRAEESIVCECKSEISLKFNVWEYPVGAHNFHNIDIDGAHLIHTFYFSVDFHDEPDDWEN